jgi:flagellar biogenesis protein FliO
MDFPCMMGMFVILLVAFLAWIVNKMTLQIVQHALEDIT